MKVKRGALVRLFEVLGVKTAAGYGDDKLLEKVQSLPELVGTEVDLETDAQVKLCSDLLDAVSCEEEIEIVEGGASPAKEKAPAKKAKAKVIEEEDDEEDDEEEELDEGEEDEPEEPAPKKKVAKKATATKAVKSKKPKVTTEPGGSGKKVVKKKPIKKTPVEEKETPVKTAKKKVVKTKTAAKVETKTAKKKVKKAEPKSEPAGRDRLGGRLGTGVADINKVLIAMKRPLHTTEIAAKCGQSTTRVSSHLCTLQGRGLVEKDEDGAFTVVAFADEE